MIGRRMIAALFIAAAAVLTLFSACASNAQTSGKDKEPGSALMETPVEPSQSMAAETGNIASFEVTGLSAESDVGTGAVLVYADDGIVVFTVRDALFIYDIERSEMRFGVDLEAAMGTDTGNTAEGLAVRASEDGRTVQIFWNEPYEHSPEPETALYADTVTGEYRREGYAPLANEFRELVETGNDRISFPDGEAYIDSTVDGSNGVLGTLADVRYVRGEGSWKLFAGYFD